MRILNLTFCSLSAIGTVFSLGVMFALLLGAEAPPIIESAFEYAGAEYPAIIQPRFVYAPLLLGAAYVSNRLLTRAISFDLWYERGQRYTPVSYVPPRCPNWQDDTHGGESSYVMQARYQLERPQT